VASEQPGWIRTLQNTLHKLSGSEVHTEEVNVAVSRVSQRLVKASITPADEILMQLETGLQGIPDAEAEQRLQRYGKNEVAHEKSPAWYRQLIQAFMNPFVGILLLLAIASYLTEYAFAPPQEQNLTTVIIITALVLISVALTFIQEYQANRAAEQLLTLVQNRSVVERKDSGRREVVTTNLVPGDIIHLAAGDIIPADVRLLATNNLSVNEAALTGESLPVEKNDNLPPDFDPRREQEYIQTANALDLDNIGFMGTDVVSGAARAVVLATGNHTYFGSMSKELVGHHPPTSFDRGVRNVSFLLIRFMLVMVPVIFLISGITQGNWFQALLFGLAVAVGLTPEMLPTIITANLAKGTLEMARRKTIIKRLNAIQNLGAMNVLCTDKTGTLTEDTVAMTQYINHQGQADTKILEYTYLNSLFQTGLRNPIDEAVLTHADAVKLAGLEERYQKVGEIPFETARRRMSVILSGGQEGHTIITKGAVAEMISISSHILDNGSVVPLDDRLRRKVEQTAHEMNDAGLRVLVVAYKQAEGGKQIYSTADETDMVLVGLIGFLDPPKETAGAAIKALNRQGIKVIVITGDNEIATRRVCREIAFEITGLMEGSEVDRMSDESLRQTVEEANVFVRTAPLQKSRILNAIKANGHTVGFLGDGINDAPALRDADVGISVDNAVDIAKESAEIILLEKSLMILEEGVGRGRMVFGNIMKYIKMTVSSNFGNVFSVIIASIFIPFPPMLPLHLLIQNLLYDISQISIPWDRMDEEYLQEPRRWNPQSIFRFTIFIGPISSIFDLTTFALLWFIFGANSPAEQSLFHTGWFVLGLLSQTLIIHLIRTRKVPFIQSMATRPVIFATVLVMVIGLVLPFTQVGAAVGFVPLPLPYFPWLFLTLLAYCVLIQIVKVWYIRRFNMWL